MSFSINFIENNLDIGVDEKYETVGEITIGEFYEYFISSTTFWSKEDYEKQWCEVVKTLSSSKVSSSAFIVSMFDPSETEYIICWPAYRENDDVYIQNRLLFLKDINGDFDVNKIGSHIGDRETVSDDGTSPSEWHTTFRELEDWLNEHRQ